jgi:hypothetical protein
LTRVAHSPNSRLRTPIALSLAWLVHAAISHTALAQTPMPPPVTWSEVTGQQWKGPGRDRVAAVIRKVDGRYTSDFRAEPRIRIDPGIRDIVVQSPPRRGFGGTERHFRLKAEPCRRYYVNVQFRSTTGTDWDPVVAKSEPIMGCRLPGAG